MRPSMWTILALILDPFGSPKVVVVDDDVLNDVVNVLEDVSNDDHMDVIIMDVHHMTIQQQHNKKKTIHNNTTQ